MLCEAGEDGTVKIWSRSGLARSNLANVGVSIYCAIWGPSGNSILHSQSNLLVITHLQGNTKRLQVIKNPNKISKNLFIGLK